MEEFCDFINDAKVEDVKKLSKFVDRNKRFLLEKCTEKVKDAIQAKILFMGRFDILDQTPIKLTKLVERFNIQFLNMQSFPGKSRKKMAVCVVT